MKTRLKWQDWEKKIFKRVKIILIIIKVIPKRAVIFKSLEVFFLSSALEVRNRFATDASERSYHASDPTTPVGARSIFCSDNRDDKNVNNNYNNKIQRICHLGEISKTGQDDDGFLLWTEITLKQLTALQGHIQHWIKRNSVRNPRPLANA